MGLGRRIVRKTVRKATPRPVRQVMHPARTVKNAVTPRPVKQASRAVYTVRHPVGATENMMIGAALNAAIGGRRRRGGRGLFAMLFGTRRHTSRQPDPPVAPTSSDRPPAVPSTAAAAVRHENPPPNATQRPEPPRRPVPVRKTPARPTQTVRKVPPKPPARTPPSTTFQSSGGAGDWELQMRRQSGLGSGPAPELPDEGGLPRVPWRL
jgi:hypothetical protein